MVGGGGEERGLARLNAKIWILSKHLLFLKNHQKRHFEQKKNKKNGIDMYWESWSILIGCPYVLTYLRFFGTFFSRCEFSCHHLKVPRDKNYYVASDVESYLKVEITCLIFLKHFMNMHRYFFYVKCHTYIT